MPEPFTAEERSRIAQVIDPLDPLLAHFALQHDLRERYLHALEEVFAILEPFDGEPEVNVHAVVRALVRLSEIVSEAINIDKIREWFDAGRPLPWLDADVGQQAARLTAEMVRMIAGEVEGVPGLVEAAEADGVSLEPRVDGEWPGDPMAGSDEQADDPGKLIAVEGVDTAIVEAIQANHEAIERNKGR